MRQLHQELFHLACEVHPTAKVLDALALGLGSKNTRTRTVCTDVVREVLQRQGVAALQGTRSRPLHIISRVSTEGCVSHSALWGLGHVVAGRWHRGA